jgi:hypothetical protein
MKEIRIAIPLKEVAGFEVAKFEEVGLEVDLTKTYFESEPYVSVIGDAETIEDFRSSTNPFLTLLAKRYKEGNYAFEGSIDPADLLPII